MVVRRGQPGFFRHLRAAGQCNARRPCHGDLPRRGWSKRGQTYSVAATSRLNVYAGTVPNCWQVVLDDRTSTLRSSRHGRCTSLPACSRVGTNRPGVRGGRTSWFHAEGATGAYSNVHLVGNRIRRWPTHRHLLKGAERRSCATSSARQRPLHALRRWRGSGAGRHRGVHHRRVGHPGGVGTGDVLGRPATTWFEAHNSFGLTDCHQVGACRRARPAGSRVRDLCVDRQSLVLPATGGRTFLRAGGQGPNRQDWEVLPTTASTSV